MQSVNINSFQAIPINKSEHLKICCRLIHFKRLQPFIGTRLDMQSYTTFQVAI